LQYNDEDSENTEEPYILRQSDEAVDEDDDEQQFNLTDLEGHYETRDNDRPTRK
jgi:hypothetical protein